MRVYPVDTIDLALAHNMTAREAPPARSTGLHMSDIYGSLYRKLEPKRFKNGPMNLGYVEAGLALEEMFEEGLTRRLMERPGEFVTESGIAYSPDGLLFDSVRSDGKLRPMVLCELKATWMSCRDCPITATQALNAGLRPETGTWDGDPDAAFPQKFDKYFCQIMAYGLHLITLDGRLYVFFVNGDYSPPKPCMLAWDLEFTDQEQAENWVMLDTHAREEGLL